MEPDANYLRAEIMPTIGKSVTKAMIQNITRSGPRGSMSRDLGWASGILDISNLTLSVQTVPMSTKPESPRIDPQTLWAKYEDIAMHFNDLLMRLRTQSLAGVAAISTLVGIFANGSNSDSSRAWLIATSLFTAMAVIWIAIFCLDFFYYNRLLNGAVSALTALEEMINGNADIQINMSTLIQEEFTQGKRAKATKGVLFFYALVFTLLIGGAAIFLRMSHLDQIEPSREAPSSSHSPAVPPTR